MHELSIAMAILEIVSEEARARNAEWVAAVHLKIGPLSGVLAEPLQSAFELACEDVPELRGSRLVVEEVPILIECPTCRGRRPAVSAQLVCCSECGTPAERIVAGRELEITAMEILE